jgi:hypothetical protein
VLIGSQKIDDYFAADLVHESGDNASNLVLCLSNVMIGATIHSSILDQPGTQAIICAPQASYQIDIDSNYLTRSDYVHSPTQISTSPSLLVVDLEPVYQLGMYSERALEILIGLGLCVIALGVTVYTLVARSFIIRPIRRLQARVSELVSGEGTELEVDTTLD